MPSLFTGSYSIQTPELLTATFFFFFSKPEGFLEQNLLFSFALETEKLFATAKPLFNQHFKTLMPILPF